MLRPDRLFIEEGWLDALRLVNEKGFAAVIVTNQKCVFKELITEQELNAIHDVIWARVQQEGLTLDGVYSAIHGDGHPDAKPQPGMLLRAAKDHALDMQRSWMIGDSERDIEAGNHAGCAKSIYVGANCAQADFQVSRISQLANILEQEL